MSHHLLFVIFWPSGSTFWGHSAVLAVMVVTAATAATAATVATAATTATRLLRLLWLFTGKHFVQY